MHIEAEHHDPCLWVWRCNDVGPTNDEQRRQRRWFRFQLRFPLPRGINLENYRFDNLACWCWGSGRSLMIIISHLRGCSWDTTIHAIQITIIISFLLLMTMMRFMIMGKMGQLAEHSGESNAKHLWQSVERRIRKQKTNNDVLWRCGRRWTRAATLLRG